MVIWDLSNNSCPKIYEQTATSTPVYVSSTSSSTAGDSEFSKTDERRLRDYIHKLKGELSTVQCTVMELESVYVDPELDRKAKNDAHRLDLENAVIMQELMAMKVDIIFSLLHLNF